MGADQVERLGLAGRQGPFGVLPASRRTRKRGALGDDTEQRQTVDRLQVLRLPDPPVEALEQEGEPSPSSRPKTAPRTVFLDTFGEDGDVGTAAACATWTLPLRSSARVPSDCARSCRASPAGAGPFLRRERRQLLVDELQGGGVVGVVAVLLLGDELVRCRCSRCRPRAPGGRGGGDVDDVRFPLRADAQVRADLFLRSAPGRAGPRSSPPCRRAGRA